MTKQHLSLLIILSIFSVIIASNHAPRIVGGRNAIPGDYPYQVSVQGIGIESHYKHFCGGTILSRLWILTAGHCDLKGIVAWKIVAGITKLNGTNPERQERKVAKFIVHPKFGINTRSSARNDIALLQLETPLEFNRFVIPIELPEAGSIPKGLGIATGWGSIAKNSTVYPNTLQTLAAPIYTDSECLKYYPRYLKKTQFCAGSLFNGMCSGDSGGPLVQNYQVIGIVSYGSIPCASGKPAVFTKISSYIDFIKKYVGH